MSKRKGFRRAKVRPGQKPAGQMNKTEARFAELLESRKRTGEIVDWKYEPIKFRLGLDFKTTYTPDFMIQHTNDTLEFVDVKGTAGWEEHTRIKIKVAATMFPMFAWSGYTEQRQQGTFNQEVFSK